MSSCCAVEQCTSVYTVQRQVFLTKNLRLFNTTAVRGGVEQCTSVYTVQRQVFLTKNLRLFTLPL